MIPARMITTVATPTASNPSNTSTVPTSRGIRWRCSQATTGEATAATTAATITGTTITEVSAASQIAPPMNSPTPTSSHAISPTSRSHCGTVKIPLSCPGSISMYSSASRPGAPPSRWRLRRPRIICAQP